MRTARFLPVTSWSTSSANGPPCSCSTTSSICSRTRDLLTEVIEQAPQVDLLTTSRERLQVQSEWVLDVDGLANRSGNGHAGDSAAVRLFVDRARQVDGAYALTDSDRPHVERVCRLVNGMPLGIELAAAWASTLPCSEIADEIERNLGFLETSMHDVPERHRSLRAAFDQSWRLLSTTSDGCSRGSRSFVAPSRGMPRPRWPEPVWLSSRGS